MLNAQINPIVEIPKYLTVRSQHNFYISKCPFCNHDDEAFTIDCKKKTYYCFHCSQKGTTEELLTMLAKDKRVQGEMEKKKTKGRRVSPPSKQS